MELHAARTELRNLLGEAVQVIGPRRVALGTGCSVASVEHWLRRSDVQLRHHTVETVLPRLRNWQAWVAGYQAGHAELARLEGEGRDTWENRLYELQERLRAATEEHDLDHLALACEVSVNQLLLWLLGRFSDRHHVDIQRALAHLRHADAWPTQEAEPANDQCVATA